MTRYTRRWTGKFANNWNTYCAPLFPPDRPPLTWLEIGIYEAQTAKWVLDNVLTHPNDSYVGIDPWEIEAMDPRKWPRDGRGQEQISAVEATARAVLKPYDDSVAIGQRLRVHLVKARSADVLRSDPVYWADGELDVAYIDGLHTPLGILSDAVLVWPLVRVGGIMIFDDYVVKVCRTREKIQRAVDSFLWAIEGSHRLLFKNNQVGIQKTHEGYQVKW